jgi:hypothetical protein
MPTTFRVLGITWRVLYTKLPANTCGECDSLTQTIRINKRMGRAMQVRTLCHELMHAAGLDEQAAGYGEMLAGILLENGDA